MNMKFALLRRIVGPVAALTLTIALVGCGGWGGPNDSTNHYLFSVGYINFAWGYNNQGIYVDEDGAVWSYDWNPDFALPPTAAWDGFDDPSAIRPDELEELFAPSRKLLRHVDKNELAEMELMIAEAAKGTISQPVSIGADAGSHTHVAYLYNSTTGTYREVLLQQRGDFRQDNDSQAAEMLVTWLDSIRK